MEKLKSTGEGTKQLKHKLHEKKEIEELLKAKIATLELNNKHSEEISQQLQNEYDALFDTNRALESQLRVFQHIDEDFKEKNSEIVRLERKIKDIESLNQEIQSKMKACEYDRDIAIQNYKDLDSLFKKQEERINEEEDQIRASQQFKETSSFEIEALRIELKNALAKKEIVEKEKTGFEAAINELKDNLINNKEFLDALKLEKNDLQSKFNKLQKELDALKSETTKPRMSISKRISIRNDNSPLGRFSLVQNLEYSMTNFRRISEGNEDEDIEDKENPEEVLKTSVKKEPEPVEKPEEIEEQLTNNTSPEKNNIESPVKIASPTEVIKRKPTTAIDLRQLSQDYLGLKHSWPIKKILQKYKERDNDGIRFSDYMYRINSKEKRERRVLFITSEALYSLRARKSSYTVIRRVPLEKISRITVSKSSAGLCAIHVHNEYDYLIDTYKRLNFLLFLQNILRFKGLKPLSIAYEQSFMVKNRKATELKKIDQYSKAVVNPELQSTYKNAQKFGELFVKTGGLFNTWAVHFFILTEVGFVCFNKAGSSKPIDFIPILGYMIIDKGIVTHGKYAFKIKFPHSDFEITLAASSEIEKKDWIQKIKMIQERAVLES